MVWLLPLTKTTEVGARKVAVTARAVDMSSEQVAPVQSPLKPLKIEFKAVVAFKAVGVVVGNGVVQGRVAEVQLTRAGVLVTAPGQTMVTVTSLPATNEALTDRS